MFRIELAQELEGWPQVSIAGPYYSRTTGFFPETNPQNGDSILLQTCAFLEITPQDLLTYLKNGAVVEFTPQKGAKLIEPSSKP